MAKLPIIMLQSFLKKLSDNTTRAYATSLGRVGQLAEREAKVNIRKNFKRSANKPISGNGLSNHTFWNFKFIDGKPTAVVGVRGVIYARLQEYGYKDLKPKKAKFLWIPLSDQFKKGSKFKNLTPREYITMKDADQQGHFFMLNKKLFIGKYAGYTPQAIAGKRTSNRKDGIRNLWLMKKSVTIPARPYLRPAAALAAAKFPEIFNDELAKLNSKG